jgi:hypothetical protein
VSGGGLSLPEPQKRLDMKAAEISKALPELPQEATPTPLGTSAAVEAVRQLALSDPVMALAKLRIELERTLRRLHARTRQPASSPGNASLTTIIRDLAAKGVLPQNLAASIHGKAIRSQDALVVAKTGGELLEGLEEDCR